MKKFLHLTCLFAFILISTNICQSQMLVPDFAMHFLAGSEDEIQKSMIDQQGNLYLVGTFKSDSLIFGVDTLMREGDNDLFLVKIDQDTNIVFAKSYYGKGAALISGIVLDSHGNICLTGHYQDSVRFDAFAFKAIAPYSWAKKSFVVKANPTGTALWAKDFGGNTSDGSMVIDANDNLYISGWFGEVLSIEGTSSMTFTVYPGNRSRQYMVKMDADGNAKWLKDYGGELMIDKDQNLYFAGSYMDSVYLENYVLRTYIAKENHNIYVAKADTNGHVIWAKKFCEGEHALLNGAIIDTVTNTIYLTGTYKTDTLTFDNHIIHNNGTADIYIAKFDTAANVLNAITIGNTAPEYAWGLTRISSQYMALLGTTFSDSIVWGSNIIYSGINPTSFGDFFLAVFDNNMAPVWGKGFPKSSGQALQSVISDANENVYVVGDFSQTKEVTTKSAFITDQPTFIDCPALYLVKFSMNATVLPKVREDTKSLTIWPNPSSGSLNISLSTASAAFDMEIFSVVGKKMIQQSSVSSDEIIDVSKFQPGLYLIRVQTKDNQILTRKFIRK
ncbi:MAG TPA: T9SS type A sorting domain-containing protein [Bacteroidales bacterium]